MRTLFSAGAILALLLLAACQQAAPAPDEPIEEEEPSVVTISVEEGAQVLEDQLGSVMQPPAIPCLMPMKGPLRWRLPPIIIIGSPGW